MAFKNMDAESSTTGSSADYLDVNAKIPGGRYDSGLSESLKAQLKS